MDFQFSLMDRRDEFSVFPYRWARWIPSVLYGWAGWIPSFSLQIGEMDSQISLRMGKMDSLFSRMNGRDGFPVSPYGWARWIPRISFLTKIILHQRIIFQVVHKHFCRERNILTTRIVLWHKLKLDKCVW